MNTQIKKSLILISALIISGCLSTTPSHVRNAEINNCLMHVSILEDSAIPPDSSDIKNCLALKEIKPTVELDTKENSLTEVAFEMLITVISSH